jgi:hypothetical protein
LDIASVTYLSLLSEVDRENARDGLLGLRADLMLHVVGSIIGVLALPPLAFAVRRPWRVARVGAWITAVVLALGLSIMIASSPELGTEPSEFDTPAVRAAASDLLAGWYPVVTSLLVAVQLVAALAFSLLLLRESASDFYARPHQNGPVGLWNFVRPPGSH